MRELNKYDPIKEIFHPVLFFISKLYLSKVLTMLHQSQQTQRNMVSNSHSFLLLIFVSIKIYFA